MSIQPLSGSGLLATAGAIQRGSERFDERVAQVVAGIAAPTAGKVPAGGDLAADVVGMRTESLTNGILYGVFRRQAEQQASLVSLLTPPPSA